MRELKVDVTFETETGNGLHMGIQCCNMIKEQIGRYPEGLIETQVLLIKKFIQYKKHYSLRKQNAYSWDNVSPSRTFSSFLHYYGRLFDTSVTFVSSHCLLTPKPVT